jgi:hypothetical protein
MFTLHWTHVEGLAMRRRAGFVVYGDDIYAGHPIPPGNVDLCIAADGERFRKLVFATLAKG